MAPKNIKPVVDVAVKYGPKAGKFIIENAAKIQIMHNTALDVKAKIDEYIINNNNNKKINIKKERLIEYNKKILKNLNKYNREELFDFKLEIKEFIDQIDKEMAKEIKVKKPIHAKRRKDWVAVLTQVDGKLKTKDYGEYLKIYNNSNYDSAYFEGFDRNIQRFKELIDKGDSEEITNFLVDQTDRDPSVIKKEFL